jgi:hypothetical protein
MSSRSAARTVDSGSVLDRKYIGRGALRGTLLLAITACGQELATAAELRDVDAHAFETVVYPILLRDCAMSECHGADARLFRVVGPGRVRLSRNTGPLEPATPDEIRISLGRARSMLEQKALEQSPLLLKPLAKAAGGASHKGGDRFGRNVYVSRDEPAYEAIARWARGER